MSSNAELIVTPRAADSVRRGHPWIFRSNLVARGGRSLPDRPSVVHLWSEQGVALGNGVFDPESPIAVRVWSTTNEGFNQRVFNERLVQALRCRSVWLHGAHTDAYRVLNGEGDRTPGVVLDRYGKVAVMRFDGQGVRQVMEGLTRDIESVLRPAGVETLLERQVRAGADGPPNSARRTTPRFGEDCTHVEVSEYGVRMRVDLERGQKTGAFLDQRENRRRLGVLVEQRRALGLGVRVLNLFSYAGGFSVVAARAGATVTSVDIAAQAHASAQENFARNGLQASAHTFVAADAFAWLGEAKRTGKKFDVVISDPPSFAPNERAKVKALGAYRALHKACVDVLAPGGHFAAASCSSHVSSEEFLSTLDDAALGRSDLRLLEVHGNPADHPSLPFFPEGRYLKLALLMG